MKLPADLYFGAIIRLSKRHMLKRAEGDKQFDKQIALLGVKYIVASYGDGPDDYQTMLLRYNVTEHAKGCMARLTPRGFLQLFPIEKTYNGAKRECKDYFSTMEFINRLDQDKPIGPRKALEYFLWEYWNWDTNHFLVGSYGLLNDIMNINGQAGPMDLAMEDILTYEMPEDAMAPAIENRPSLHIVK